MPGYLEHGIVDPVRQRKPSYFAWAELNAPARTNKGPFRLLINLICPDGSQAMERVLASQ